MNEQFMMWASKQVPRLPDSGQKRRHSQKKTREGKRNLSTGGKGEVEERRAGAKEKGREGTTGERGLGEAG